MKSNSGAKSYLHTKILTASPEDLRLMLYEGAIKFCRQAKDAIANKDIEGSFNALMRTQKIVLELSTSLNHEIAPDLCKKLSEFYIYIYSRLVGANADRDAKAVDEVLQLLEFEKQTWQELMERMAEQANTSRRVEQTDINGAQQTAISSFSMDV